MGFNIFAIYHNWKKQKLRDQAMFQVKSYAPPIKAVPPKHSDPKALDRTIHISDLISEGDTGKKEETLLK